MSCTRQLFIYLRQTAAPRNSDVHAVAGALSLYARFRFMSRPATCDPNCCVSIGSKCLCSRGEQRAASSEQTSPWVPHTQSLFHRPEYALKHCFVKSGQPVLPRYASPLEQSKGIRVNCCVPTIPRADRNTCQPCSVADLTGQIPVAKPEWMDQFISAFGRKGLQWCTIALHSTLLVDF